MNPFSFIPPGVIKFGSGILKSAAGIVLAGYTADVMDKSIKYVVKKASDKATGATDTDVEDAVEVEPDFPVD